MPSERGPPPGVSLSRFVEMAVMVAPSSLFAESKRTKEALARYQQLATAAFVSALPNTTLHRTSGGARLLQLGGFQQAAMRLSFGLIGMPTAAAGATHAELLQLESKLAAEQLEAVCQSMQTAIPMDQMAQLALEPGAEALTPRRASSFRQQAIAKLAAGSRSDRKQMV